MKTSPDIDCLRYFVLLSGLHPPSGLTPDIDCLRYFDSEYDVQLMSQSNVNSLYQGLNQREDEVQSMSQSNVNSLYQGLNQREDEDQTIRQSNVNSLTLTHCLVFILPLV
jgi:hypothetical protein